MSGLRLDSTTLKAVGGGPTRLATSNTPKQIQYENSFINEFNSFAPFTFAQKAGEALTSSAYQATKGVADIGVRGIEDIGVGLGGLASGAYSAITGDETYNSLSDFTNSASFAEMNAGIKQALGGGAKVATAAGALPYALAGTAVGTAIQLIPGAENVVGSALEKFNEGIDAATSTSGIKFDDDAKQGVQDLVFALAGRFGLPVLGALSKEAKARVKGLSDAIGESPEFMKSSIDDSLSSRYKSDAKIEGINEILAKFSDELNKKAENLDRQVTHYDVMQAAKESGIDINPNKLTPSSELINPSNIEGSIDTKQINLNEVFTDKIADAISLNKKDKSTLISNVSKETNVPEAVVSKNLDEFLLTNKRIADSASESTLQIKKSFDGYMNPDTPTKVLSYDVKNLVDNGMLKEVASETDGMVRFEPTDSGKRYIGKGVAIEAKELSVDSWAKAKSEGTPTPFVKMPEEVVNKVKANEIDKAIDKPDTIAKVLAKFRESGDDINKITSKDTKTATLNRVMKDIEMYAAEGNRSGVVSSIISDLKYLGKKALVDVSKAWEESAGSVKLKPSELFDTISELNKVKNDGWFNYSKLPVPKNLTSMIRRDSKVAERAFSSGEKQARAVAESKISILKEKMQTASLEERAAYRSQIKQIKEQASRNKDFTKSIFSTLDEIKSKGKSGDYVFYGDDSTRKTAMNKIIADYKTKISNVSTYADYINVTNKLAQTIEETNRKTLTKEVSSFLKKYRRAETPSTVDPKKVNYEERVVLEKVARTFDDYKNGLGVEQLAKLKEYLKTKEELGKKIYTTHEVLTASGAEAKANLIKNQGYKELLAGSDEISPVTGKVDAFKQQMLSTKKNVKYSFDDFHRQFLKMFGDDMNSIGYKMIGDIDLARNKYNHVKEDVGQKILKFAAKFKPDEVQRAEMSFLALLRQPEWEKNVFYNKKGEYIGKDIPQFKNLPKFPTTESEFNSFVSDIKKRYEGTEMFEGLYGMGRKLFDEYFKKIQEVNVQLDNSAAIPIENYWTIRNKGALKPGEKGFAEIDNVRKDIGDGFNKSRTYEISRSGLDLDIVQDMLNFIDKQVYYAEVRLPFERFRSTVKNVVADSNEYTKRLTDEYLQEVGNPSNLPHNILNSLMARVSANTLGGAATTVFKQFLVLPDAVGFTGFDNLSSGLAFAGLYPSAQALKNHKLMKDASSFLAHSWGSDYTINKDLEVGFNSKLKKVDEFMLTPMKAADYYNKSAIWAALYLKEVKKQGFTGTLQDIADSGGFKNKNAIRIADDITQRIAGSIDTTRLPPILRNPIGRAFMQLQSNAVNRWQLVTNDVPRLFKEDPKMGTVAALGMVASSATEAYMSAISLYLRGKMEIKPDNEQSINEIAQGLKPGEEQDLESIASFVVATIAKQNPVIGSIMNATDYKSSGNATIDALKKAYSSSKSAVSNISDGNDEKASADLATLFTTFFGYSPTKNLLDSWKTAIKENQ